MTSLNFPKSELQIENYKLQFENLSGFLKTQKVMKVDQEP